MKLVRWNGREAILVLSAKLMRHFIEQDAKLVKAARHINVLSALSWPRDVAAEFLAAHAAGRTRLPEIDDVHHDLKDVSQELIAIVRACDSDHPISRFLSRTAQSYFEAARMLESTGTHAFRELSETLYGSTQEKIGHRTTVAWADRFLEIADDGASEITESQTPSLASETVARELKRRADDFFVGHDIQVTIDANLVAMAAAGAARLRIRSDTHFSSTAVDQLLQHELMVHSATMINGRSQPYLRTLGLGAPRTTVTQEGLATFAEIVTGSMDVSRLRRIALRIKATHRACEGDDFIGTFRFFLASGQTPQESFHLAARIFRGGNLQGRDVFTKDVVYLKGLFLVHAFMRRSVEDGQFALLKWLFAGRLTPSDVLSLQPHFDASKLHVADAKNIDHFYIHAPQYLPPWLVDPADLTSRMDSSILAQKFERGELSWGEPESDLVESWQDAS